MNNNHPEEIDLLFLYNKVRSIYLNFLLNLYRFLVRFWYVLIIVLVLGYLLGLYLQNNKEKLRETQLLVQINFDSADYVYDAVNQLKKKINEGDGTALNELKDDFTHLFKIRKIEIEPIPDIRDLNNGMDPNNRNVDTYLDQSKYEDDLLISEMFVSQYRLHRIKLTTTSDASPQVINTILSYFNNNPKFDEIKVIGLKNLANEVAETKESIEEIDMMLKAYGTVVEGQTNPGTVYINTSSPVNQHFLVQEKTKLVKDLQIIETDLLRGKDGILSLINKPMLQKKTSFLDRTTIIMPIIFLFFLVVSIYLVALFKKLEKIDQESSK
ncbi:hypothetical protein KXJ69_03995 [Aureisphaera sp. CAU 1614]|uniref:Uncharacterized protein n=1 Tax=Halomarinibacterium sedimenti TaxID=2857106 RepID=A0A9X1FN40_9FLAO|nr:hypothetical protein [Halomarinibacterium sedimenti]MBW2937253.1 hypothetical protein [Halomarinibacterium sedimenti]